MNAATERKIVYVVPRTWLGRLVAALATIALIILAVFFFAIFLTIFAVLAVVIIGRILWGQRQRRQKTSERIIDGEYSEEVSTPWQSSKHNKADLKHLDDRTSGNKQ